MRFLFNIFAYGVLIVMFILVVRRFAEVVLPKCNNCFYLTPGKTYVTIKYEL